MVENDEGVVMRWPGETVMHGSGFWLPAGWIEERERRMAAGGSDEGFSAED